jgi:hypothetical protein
VSGLPALQSLEEGGASLTQPEQQMHVQKLSDPAVLHTPPEQSLRLRSITQEESRPLQQAPVEQALADVSISVNL